MIQKTILFDFDNTICDTSGTVDNYCRQFEKRFSIPTEKTLQVLAEYKATLDSSTDFRPEDFARKIAKSFGFDFNLLLETLLDIRNYPKFDEVDGVLSELSKKYSLGIFSEGFEDWQRKKIDFCGVLDFFDQNLIIIERRKLSPESINRIPTGATVIDDKKIVVETLAETRSDLKLIWLNRLSDEKVETPQIRTIKNLNELLAMS